MRRREFVALLAVTMALPPVLRAQPQPGKTYRIGYLSQGTASGPAGLLEAFRGALRELGWVEGQNISIEYRYAEGQADRLAGLAGELVGLKVDLIAATTTPASLAARDATKTIPIVGISFDNPLLHGLVASLARPGGNVTGVSYSAGPEIFGKDLELFGQLLPDLRHVAVLSNSTGPNHAPMISNIRAAAGSLGIQLLVLDVQRPDEFEAAFATMAKERVAGLFVFGDPMFSLHRERLAELAVSHRLPTMYTNRPHVEAGGLMCYGPNFADVWRRAAAYVDKILRGERPADIPVEQPTKFELVINLKTARALGITVPPNLLARADEVIE